jgi:membrane-bound lytic murein transglycosylase
MAVPGFSVSDLIQALGQVKIVYDAFFNEYTNTAAQVRDLADDIEQFRKNLEEHKEITEQGGLEYTGYASVQRTLEACYRYLDDYKDVLDKRRKKSVVGAYKTARFAFDQDEVNRLRGQIARHQADIQHYSMNIVL